jgi:hypothetical protein
LKRFSSSIRREASIWRLPNGAKARCGALGCASEHCHFSPLGYQWRVQKNFTIEAFAEVIVGGRSIDLHNFYRAASIGTGLSGDSIALRFERDHRWPGSEGLPETVTLTCSENLRMAFNDLVDSPVPLGEDAVEIAYYDSECEWDAFLDEGVAAARGFEGLHIRFSGGFVLRIRSDMAEVTTA